MTCKTISSYVVLVVLGRYVTSWFFLFKCFQALSIYLIPTVFSILFKIIAQLLSERLIPFVALDVDWYDSLI